LNFIFTPGAPWAPEFARRGFTDRLSGEAKLVQAEIDVYRLPPARSTWEIHVLQFHFEIVLENRKFMQGKDAFSAKRLAEEGLPMPEAKNLREYPSLCPSWNHQLQRCMSWGGVGEMPFLRRGGADQLLQCCLLTREQAKDCEVKCGGGQT